MPVLDKLDQLMTIDDALRRFKHLFHADGSPRTARDRLMAACRAEQIHHVRFGRKRFVSERDIQEYLALTEAGPKWQDRDETTHSPSAAGTSPASPDAPPSTGNALSEAQEESVAEALRQRIGQKPSAASRPSSRSIRKATSRPRRGKSS
jgi:hypothetical protein